MKAMFRGRMPRLHFVGVGGIGMSGIAEILLRHGYQVSGSDLSASDVTERLASLGARISIGHSSQNVLGAEVVVVSTAIHPDNPELVAAKVAKLPVVHRGEMLAELMRLRSGIAIAGSHGKTTTTSLTAHLLFTAGLDPMAVVGGVVKNFGSNAKSGLGDYLVAEADESDRSFLHLFPTVAIVTNIDPEHLEHYPDGFPELLMSFKTFINNLPFYGLAVLCTDHPNVRALLPSIKKRYVTYGIGDADYTLKDFLTAPTGVSFVPVRRGDALPRVEFSMVGEHNAQNALAVLAVADDLGIPFDVYQKAMASFAGVGRRFELKGEARGVTVYDDYGHHPAELIATIAGARRAFGRRVIVVFQPHRYTRTRDLLRDFGRAFGDADVLVLADIYGAGEEPLPGVSGHSIFEEVKKNGHADVTYVPDKSHIAAVVASKAQAGDLVITLGAGDISKISGQILSVLEAHG